MAERERERETREGWGLRVLRKEHLGVYREENKRGGGRENIVRERALPLTEQIKVLNSSVGHNSPLDHSLPLNWTGLPQAAIGNLMEWKIIYK